MHYECTWLITREKINNSILLKCDVSRVDLYI